ncbi:MAG TPA: hypothetical protein VGM90_36045 [Kofleriaceae bacterium]|jgi:ribosomal protein S27AE
MTQAGDVVDYGERECPRCRAIVFFATTDDPSATCTACSMRPLPARRVPVPFVIDPVDDDDDQREEKGRLVSIVGATCALTCVASFALGGVVIGAVAILGAVLTLAIATRKQPALKGVDE